MSTTRRVRCTVESMNYSACGMRVGDHFEVGPEGLSLPEGQPFCWFAIASVLPLLSGRIGPAGDGWLESRPLVACPDPPEALYLRLEVLDDDARRTPRDDARRTPDV